MTATALSLNISQYQPKQLAILHFQIARWPTTDWSEVAAMVQSLHPARDVASSAMLTFASCHLLLVLLSWGRSDIGTCTCMDTCTHMSSPIADCSWASLLPRMMSMQLLHSLPSLTYMHEF